MYIFIYFITVCLGLFSLTSTPINIKVPCCFVFFCLFLNFPDCTFPCLFLKLTSGFLLNFIMTLRNFQKFSWKFTISPRFCKIWHVLQAGILPRIFNDIQNKWFTDFPWKSIYQI